MVGPHVTDLIGEASLAKVLDATPWEISQAIHPHPSLNEVLVESALAVDDRAIHFNFLNFITNISKSGDIG